MALSLDRASGRYRGANSSLCTRYETIVTVLRERFGLRSRLEGRFQWLSWRWTVVRPQG
jgi:hypothetical protein